MASGLFPKWLFHFFFLLPLLLSYFGNNCIYWATSFICPVFNLISECLLGIKNRCGKIYIFFHCWAACCANDLCVRAQCTTVHALFKAKLCWETLCMKFVCWALSIKKELVWQHMSFQALLLLVSSVLQNPLVVVLFIRVGFDSIW